MNYSMKTFFFSGLLATFTLTSASAADLTAKGLELGLNMANFHGTDAQPAGVTNSSRAGVSVGAFSVWGFTDKLSLQSEALYIQKGVTRQISGTNTPVTLSYLEIPMTMQYSFPVSGLKLNLFGGPYMGVLLSADSNGTDIKSTTKTLDYGMQFGVGTIIKKKYLFDARYSMGLASIDNSGSSADMKNSGILVTSGYLF